MAQFLHQLQFQSKSFQKILTPRKRGSSLRRHSRSRKPFSRRSSNPASASRVWLWGLSLVGVMLVWNWQLLLATAVGMGVLIVLFQFPFDRWSLYWEKWQQANLSQQRLLMALAGSSVAGIGVYWALQLWDHLDNHWLAASSIAQGVILTSLLSIQLAKLLTSPAEGWQRDRFSQQMEALSADHPLKRLIAVRELTQLAITGKLRSEQLKQISEYFSLLFAVETEPILRQGLLESMQTLQLHHCWQNWEKKTSQPLQKLEKVKKELIINN